MPDVADFAGMIVSLRAVADLTKLVVDAHDAGIRREKSIELQGQVVSALQSALTAQTAQATQLQRVRELEEKVAQLETWNTEKKKYELKNIRPDRAPGGKAFAYVLKDDAGSTEPAHSICPDCYEDGRKSILQGVTLTLGRIDVVDCNRCGLRISVTGVTNEDRSKPRPRRA